MSTLNPSMELHQLLRIEITYPFLNLSSAAIEFEMEK